MDDAALPGLRLATDPTWLAGRLAGPGSARIDPGTLVLRRRARRPGRRAVIEVTGPGVHVFVKVVRPSTLEALVRRHDLLAGAGLPVPEVLAWDGSGVVVLAALPGRLLREEVWRCAVGRPTAAARIAGDRPPGGGYRPARGQTGHPASAVAFAGAHDPAGRGTPRGVAADVADLLDALPAPVMELPRRRSVSERAPAYARRVAALLPDQAERCVRLADEIAARVRGLPDDGPTHGDLYDKQVLVDDSGERVVGLLDLDTVGPGRRADDVAGLVGHVEVLVTVVRGRALGPGGTARVHALADLWLHQLAGGLDLAEVRTRVAGVLLSLATGPHRVGEASWRRGTLARLDLAESWLARH